MHSCCFKRQQEGVNAVIRYGLLLKVESQKIGNRQQIGIWHQDLLCKSKLNELAVDLTNKKA